MFGDFYFISVARPVETVWVQGKPRVRRRRNLPNSLFSTDTSWYFRPASLTNFWLYQLCHICSPYYDLHYKLHQKRNFRNSGQYIYFWKNSEGGRKEWMTAFLPLCHKVSSNVFNSLHSLFIIAWTPSQISLCLINLFSLYIFQIKYHPYTLSTVSPSVSEDRCCWPACSWIATLISKGAEKSQDFVRSDPKY